MCMSDETFCLVCALFNSSTYVGTLNSRHNLTSRLSNLVKFEVFMTLNCVQHSKTSAAHTHRHSHRVEDKAKSLDKQGSLIELTCSPSFNYTCSTQKDHKDAKLMAQHDPGFHESMPLDEQGDSRGLTSLASYFTSVPQLSLAQKREQTFLYFRPLQTWCLSQFRERFPAFDTIYPTRVEIKSNPYPHFARLYCAFTDQLCCLRDIVEICVHFRSSSPESYECGVKRHLASLQALALHLQLSTWGRFQLGAFP